MERVPFGLCGMPCGLCPMHYIKGDSRCVGCKEDGDSFSVQCKIFQCCMGKGLQSCGQCGEYPCGRIDGMDEFKGFNTGKVWLSICAAIGERGVEAWYPEYEERCLLLADVLEKYNDGRMKNYLCRLFVLGDMETLQAIMKQAQGIPPGDAKVRGKQFKQIVNDIAGSP